MADADPFVKRMLARSEARRAQMARLGDGNLAGKENKPQHSTEQPVPCNHKGASQMDGRDDADVLSRPNSVLQTANTELVPPPPAPPLPSSNTQSPSKGCSSIRTNSPSKTHSPSRSYSPSKTCSPSKSMSPCKTVSSVPHHSPTPRPAAGGRLTALARRQQQMQEWEDDYNYHSSSTGGGAKVATAAHSSHGVAPSLVNSGSAHSPLKHASPQHFHTPHHVSPNKHTSPSKTTSSGPATPTYHYGDFPPASPSKRHVEHIINRPRAVSTDLDAAASANSASSKVLPTAAPNHGRDLSPASKMFWDRKLISSLEAQGFTPTTSQSRLIYDFKREQAEHRSHEEQAPEEAGPPPEPAAAEPRSCHQTDGGGGAAAPKILSCVMKDSPSPDRCGQPTERGRTNSGVQQLRSRWEQQIRDQSPEKQPPARERSCSPNKPFSARRSVSPTKRAALPPSAASPSKSCSSLGGVQLRPVSQASEARGGVQLRPVSQAYEAESRGGVQLRPVSQGTEARGGVQLRPVSQADVRASCVAEVAARGHARGRSPTKAATVNSRTQAHEVVKGVCPMPSTRPVLEEPHQSSVLARAAAFTAVMDQVPEVPQKDPAELSLQSRRQLFERQGEEALLPKAPFASSVPSKVLSSGCAAPFQAPRPQQRARPRSTVPTAGVYRCHEALAAAASAPSTDSAWQQQRQRELQALHDGFPGAAVPRHNDDSSDDSDGYPESESSYPDSSSTVPITSPGPPKPPRVHVEGEYYHEDMAPPAPPQPEHHSRSPHKAGPRASPVKHFEPRVKDGCLYPGLSDVESQSEADPDDRPDDSVMTCASEESLGAHIQRMARADRVPHTPLHALREEEDDDSIEKGDLSAALDEAFSDEEATTPPKRLRDQEQPHDSPCSRGQHKTPRLDGSPARPPTGDTPLTHTISMYRKQRPTEVHVTPVRQLIHRPPAEQVSSPAPAVESPSVTATVRIKQLAAMESSELRIISQASVAVSVAEQRPDQRGAAHHIEAEKLLLLATHRRQAVLAEIQRVKTEASMGGASWSQEPDTSRGSLTLSDLSLPLSQDFLGKGLSECPQHVVVLVKHRELVVSSVVQSTPACVVNGALSFPTSVTLDDLTPDFVVTLEVYALKMASAPNTNLKKDPSRMKLTPLKRLQQQHGSRGSPACTVSSPGGPGAVRTSAFALIGFTHLTIATLNRSAWTLDKVPLSSPLSGHLLLRVQCQLQGGVSGRGFLTAFQDVGGLGAWTRRWAALDGPTVRFWSYPDHENKKECIHHVPLKLVSTRRVELVSRDVCARPNTFLLTTVRPTQAGDTNSLVTDLTGNTTVTKHLLSADSTEERIEWCRKLNIALANIRAWDPDAVRPHHYNV